MQAREGEAFRVGRRGFLGLSTMGAAALSTMSAGAWITGCTSKQPAAGMTNLRPEDVELLRAITPAVMKGKVEPGSASLDQTIQSFDTLMGDLSPYAVGELHKAFDVLSFGPTRGVMTGQWSSWSSASVEDADRALARLRDSRFELLNAIYAGTIRMVSSSWYLIPENQLTTGYPGPPKRKLVVATNAGGAL